MSVMGIAPNPPTTLPSEKSAQQQEESSGVVDVALVVLGQPFREVSRERFFLHRSERDLQGEIWSFENQLELIGSCKGTRNLRVCKRILEDIKSIFLIKLREAREEVVRWRRHLERKYAIPRLSVDVVLYGEVIFSNLQIFDDEAIQRPHPQDIDRYNQIVLSLAGIQGRIVAYIFDFEAEVNGGASS
jgi:superfamily II helicase